MCHLQSRIVCQQCLQRRNRRGRLARCQLQVGQLQRSLLPRQAQLFTPGNYPIGGHFVDDPGQLPFGTDFGNVSQRVPAALIGIGRPGGWAFHTDEGAKQFEQDGEEAALSIAQVLALASARLLAPR